MSSLVTMTRGATEAEFYGLDPRDESGCPLSAPELALLREFDSKLIPFRVTVTTAAGVENINILATDACMANMRALEILFPDFDGEIPVALKIKVEPNERPR